MNQLNNMLFALLRSLLCGEELDRSDLEGIDEEGLEKLYRLAKKHDIAHLLGISLEKFGLLSDSAISKRIVKEQYVAIYRYENLKYELERISSVLEKEGIAYIPLKGAVIRELYPECWMRTSCDIDVLVHEEVLDRAVESLVNELGYKANKKRDYHDISLFSESGVHLELHFNIKENVLQLDRVLSKAWEYAYPQAEGSYKYCLCNDFLIYQSVAHAAYHFVGGGCGLRPFIDLWLMTNALEYSKEKLAELCRESGIEGFFNEAMAFAKAILEKGQRTELTDRIEAYIIEGGAYGTKEAHIAARQTARGGKRGYAISRIFTSYGNLKVRYPSLKSRAAAPIYQVRRWFDLIKDGRLEKAVNELSINGNLDENKANVIDGLMTDLGLKDYIK